MSVIFSGLEGRDGEILIQLFPKRFDGGQLLVFLGRITSMISFLHLHEDIVIDIAVSRFWRVRQYPSLFVARGNSCTLLVIAKD
jgi:hypothetical protein